MMRGFLSSLIVVSFAFGVPGLSGVALADESQPADPMPAEQGPPKPAEASKAPVDSKFEVVKKTPPTEGGKPSTMATKPAAKIAKTSKHKARHKARKHKKAHRKARKSAP